MVSNQLVWNISSILPNGTTIVENGNGWMLYVFAALVFGIIIGGAMRGLAKLVLGGVLLSGFAILVMVLLQKDDIISTIVSVVFGLILLLFSFLAKVGKTYPYIKR